MSNLKSVALIILEVLASNAETFRCHSPWPRLFFGKNIIIYHNDRTHGTHKRKKIIKTQSK